MKRIAILLLCACGGAPAPVVPQDSVAWKPPQVEGAVPVVSYRIGDAFVVKDDAEESVLFHFGEQNERKIHKVHHLEMHVKVLDTDGERVRRLSVTIVASEQTRTDEMDQTRDTQRTGGPLQGKTFEVRFKPDVEQPEVVDENGAPVAEGTAWSVGRCVQFLSVPDAVAPLVRGAKLGESRPAGAKKFVGVVYNKEEGDEKVSRASMTLRETRDDVGIFDVEVETESSDMGTFVSHASMRAEVHVRAAAGRVVYFRVSESTKTSPVDSASVSRGDATYTRTFEVR